MAASINIAVYSDALVVLATAGVVVPVVRKFGVSPILGFLSMGALLGPLGLGSYLQQMPFLYWLTVVDAKNISGIAELGIVFLLFLIGLELSFARLTALKRLVFGLGTAQILISTIVIAMTSRLVAYIKRSPRQKAAGRIVTCHFVRYCDIRSKPTRFHPLRPRRKYALAGFAHAAYALPGALSSTLTKAPS